MFNASATAQSERLAENGGNQLNASHFVSTSEKSKVYELTAVRIKIPFRIATTRIESDNGTETGEKHIG